MSDKIVRAITSDGAVMAAAITAKDMVETARQLHTTLPVATAALGRSLMAASLMGNQLKGDENSLSLQFNGGGPLGKILCVADYHGNVRGVVENPYVHLPDKYQGKLDVGAAVGKDGTLTVIKDLGMKEPYVGSVPLVSGEIAEDVTAYYAISEQFPTACALGVLLERDQSVSSAGGYLVQLLPGADESTIDMVEAAVTAFGSVTPHLQEGMTPEEMLHQVLAGFEVEILDESAVSYKCTCSRERYRGALLTLATDDLQELADDPAGVELKCQFCATSYRFSQKEVQEILRERLKKVQK